MPDPQPIRFPTAHDVARLAGVSQSAVSRAFTKGASISPELREVVLAAAARLGYRPNIVARSLITQKSQLVGVIVGNFENPFFTISLEALSAALSRSGLRILLLTTEPRARTDELIDELLSYRVAALVLMAVDISSTLAGECERAGIPVVLFNRIVSEGEASFAVTADNEGGAAAIARHLIATGRRKLAFMAGHEGSSTSRSREAGFMQAAREAGLPSPRRVVGRYDRSDAAEAARALFSDPRDRPEGLFCANDLMAIAAMEALRAEFRLEPGSDYALAGFDNIPMAAWPSYSLTTYSQPVDEMVEHAVRFITAPSAPSTERRIAVPGRLILRKTA
jgi:DNA-binding LacI/PurR family transcriptional regulator